MNAELIRGIDTVISGLALIKNALATEEVSKPVAVETTPVKGDESTSTINGYSKEQIEGMKYNEFKKFAAQLGVKCTGTRSEIMEHHPRNILYREKQEKDTKNLQNQ